MLCTLDAGDFVLTMEPVLFPEDAPVNTLLRLRVRSGSFAAQFDQTYLRPFVLSLQKIIPNA